MTTCNVGNVQRHAWGPGQIERFQKGFHTSKVLADAGKGLYERARPLYSFAGPSPPPPTHFARRRQNRHRPNGYLAQRVPSPLGKHMSQNCTLSTSPTPSPPTRSLDFRGFDSSRLLILRGGNSHVHRIL